MPSPLKADRFRQKRGTQPYRYLIAHRDEVRGRRLQVVYSSSVAGRLEPHEPVQQGYSRDCVVTASDTLIIKNTTTARHYITQYVRPLLYLQHYAQP